MLHHLVSNNPHLYDILDKEGLGDAARGSSQRHLERTYGPAPEQLKLFED
jgi:hypothetical protein